jgi:signal transduction histidine kinase/ActR/RegA family two-component response regulator
MPPFRQTTTTWSLGTPQMSSDSDRLLVNSERIKAVFQQAPLTLVVTIINSMLTAFVLAPVVNPTLLSIWTGLVVLVSVARGALRYLFFRRQPEGMECQPWAVMTILGSLTTGILWGGVAALLPAIETYQLFLSFVIGGMCAGTTTVNSAHFPSVFAFILPSTLPLAVAFLAQSSTPRLVPALMIVIFASALCLASLRGHRAFGDRIRLQLALGRRRRKVREEKQRLRKEIAERQKAEATLQQAQKMEAIGHLTGGIAHDFNNLLQIVIGNLNLIRRLSTDNRQILDYTRAAERAADRGARLTSSLLTFARRQMLRAERVDLNALLQEFQPLLLQALGEKIHFQTKLEPALANCHVDPAHFQSAILNLAINARDAMPEGGQLLITTGITMLNEQNVREISDAKPGLYVRVSVQDSGFGMSEETMARVFEPFFTTKGVGQGSGLGLSQVYGFASQSGGCVQLRSKPGEGTCVTICLPAANEVPNAPLAETATEEADTAYLGVTALVVEDNLDVLETIVASLSAVGCCVQAAQTGYEALEILRRENDICILLIDIALPDGLSGTDLGHIARKLRPALPVILITGRSTTTPIAENLRAVEFPLLYKPFRASELVAQIRGATEAGRSSRAAGTPATSCRGGRTPRQ